LPISDKSKDREFSAEEVRHRFEAALRGAMLVGHKPQSEMKLGKPRAKPKRATKRKAKKPGR
jgi:hypothetical protein